MFITFLLSYLKIVLLAIMFITLIGCSNVYVIDLKKSVICFVMKGVKAKTISSLVEKNAQVGLFD